VTGAWRLAVRNLARNRRRNLATAMAVALGYAALIVLAGYVVRVERYLRTSTVYLQHRGHVALFMKGGLERHLVRPKAYSVSAADQAAIAEVLAGDGDVEFWGRSLVGMGLAGNGCTTVPFIATGVEPEIDRRIREHPEVQRYAPELAPALRGQTLGSAAVEDPVLVTATLAHRLGKTRVHDELDAAAAPAAIDCRGPEAATRIAADANVQLAGATFGGSFGAVDGEVVGIFSTGASASEETGLLTSLDELQRLYDTDGVTQVSVYLRRPSSATAAAARLERALARRGVDVDAYPYTDGAMNPWYVGTVRFLVVMAVFIVAVVATVVLLSVLSSMTMTILERSREIGTLRSLGFRRRHVIGLFLREGLVLTMAALLVGLGLGLVTAALVNGADVRFYPPGVPQPIQLLLTPEPVLCAGLAIVLLALGAGATWLATRRSVKRNIVHLNAAITA
jgi:putative ABC transport system permease protein